ncbi:glycosyltransferase [Acuticoccus sp. M5D2P5]|uniref:glycosyltransferase n=1 Tax=Acuticoccus kalidii TaxID=2910977 RepID=UPI001F21C0F4|nr:glycosyltransferase [Acuticoccus kalidii]MCF3935165.1 glycosyltransferase [Acuticoccus kalidii]
MQYPFGIASETEGGPHLDHDGRTRTRRKIAIIYYWLVKMRGGERVLEEMLKLYPQADIFTHVAIPERLSDIIRAHRITETFIGRLPGARAHYKAYLPLMPRALEELDLSGYDLVISVESGPAKGVIVPPGVPHICYCNTPMRYIWDQYGFYCRSMGTVQRFVFGHVAHQLRQWDVSTAARVDHFVANSSFAAERIRRYYGRESTVINPPVDLSIYRPGPQRRGAHFLFISELVPYKRADIAIEAFSRLGLPLTVVGSGDGAAALKQKAGDNVRFLGRVPNEELAVLYRTARAVIFPPLEDFGIVPVEAMASGVPVIAYGKGGVRDSVIDGETGLFFDTQSTEALIEAVERFCTIEDRFDPERIVAQARLFSQESFRQRFGALVERTMHAHETRPFLLPVTLPPQEAARAQGAEPALSTW